MVRRVALTDSKSLHPRGATYRASRKPTTAARWRANSNWRRAPRDLMFAVTTLATDRFGSSGGSVTVQPSDRPALQGRAWSSQEFGNVDIAEKHPLPPKSSNVSESTRASVSKTNALIHSGVAERSDGFPITSVVA